MIKPTSYQTAMPQRLYSAQKICQCALGSPRIMLINIKFARHSVHTTSSQRPCSVLTTFPQHPYSVYDAIMAHKKMLQCAHCAHTARTHLAYNAFTDLIAFAIIYTYFYILSNTVLQRW